MAQIRYDGTEIDSVKKVERFGDWITFTDSDGANFKVTPEVVNVLYAFWLANKSDFESGD